MNRRRHLPAQRGFSLIELILVVAIIALSASLLFPVSASIMDRANTQKCLENLRQIGIAVHLAAVDNDNRYPRIEIDPQNPIYAPEEGAKPLHEALLPYGITDKVLQCPADLNGPNWYSRVKTSYMWQPYSEDEPTANITIYTRRGGFPGRPSRVRLATDYEAVHTPDAPGGRKKMNVVYADGHVVSR
ncbi:MAG: type II secretion system GspH family protein [Verrucomicrobiota bacterium]|nr:type II secretion system GspH family protein [Verrucomicrobiota bacterium]